MQIKGLLNNNFHKQTLVVQKKKIKKANKCEIKKYNKTTIKDIHLKENEINEIINENNYIPIKSTINKITAKCIYLYKSKNYILYICNKRKQCKGRGKGDLKNKIFKIN
jgi:hypothetical protein